MKRKDSKIVGKKGEFLGFNMVDTANKHQMIPLTLMMESTKKIGAIVNKLINTCLDKHTPKDKK